MHLNRTKLTFLINKKEFLLVAMIGNVIITYILPLMYKTICIDQEKPMSIYVVTLTKFVKL